MQLYHRRYIIFASSLHSKSLVQLISDNIYVIGSANFKSGYVSSIAAFRQNLQVLVSLRHRIQRWLPVRNGTATAG